MPFSRPSTASLQALEEPQKPVVLCVDDDGAVLSSLRRLFRGEPFEVVTTSSPGKALACLRRHPVAVIISDERMPGTTGSEFLAEVRARWPWIGRVLLTAYPGRDVMIRGFQVGIDFMLHKPWDGESFKRTIERLIQVAEKTRSKANARGAQGVDPSEGREGG